MIESILKIGQSVLESGSGGELEFLKAQAETIKGYNAAKKQYIAVLELTTSTKNINVQHREIDDDTPSEFLWLENAPRASFQDRLTTNNLKYLVSQSIPMLANLLPKGSELKKCLMYIRRNFFLDLGSDRERYRYIVNPELIFSGKQFQSGKSKGKDIWKEIKGDWETTQTNAQPKDLPDKLAKLIQKRLLPRDVLLFTISLDGEILVHHPDYQAHLYKVKAKAPFEDVKQGVCHLTGNFGKVTANTKNFKFKYYITDKLGFSSGFKKLEQGGFDSTFAIGEGAYRALLCGERFIRREMRLNGLGRCSVYLIPDFHTSFVKGFSQTLVDITDSINWVGKKLRAVEEELEEQLEDNPLSTYLLNFLFFFDDGQKFKVTRLIQDVPTTRLTHITRAGIKAGEVGKRYFTETNQWKISLNKMYFLIPVRKKQEQRILTLYESLFTSQNVQSSILIKDFIELAKVYSFPNLLEHGGYQISDPTKDVNRDQSKSNHQLLDNALVDYIANTQLLLWTIRELKLLKEGKMDNDDWIAHLEVGDNYKDYIREMKFNEPQAALFFLGSLIGSIGSVQASRADDGQGKKVILNKLNYQGMSFHRIQRLATELFEKLIQYKVLPYNEAFHAEAKRLLEPFANKPEEWKLTPYENVYYILSGYSYSVLQSRRQARKKAQAKNQTNNQRNETLGGNDDN